MATALWIRKRESTQADDEVPARLQELEAHLPEGSAFDGPARTSLAGAQGSGSSTGGFARGRHRSFVSASDRQVLPKKVGGRANPRLDRQKPAAKVQLRSNGRKRDRLCPPRHDQGYYKDSGSGRVNLHSGSLEVEQ
jgi:hypothetical protein